jgi:hypothetical protein
MLRRSPELERVERELVVDRQACKDAASHRGYRGRMNRETLLQLALQAIDDADARVVLGDALLVSEWDDSLVWETHWYLTDPCPAHGPRLWSDADVTEDTISDGGIHHRRDHAKAVAAALLFGNWPTSWPLAEANATAVQVSRALSQFFPDTATGEELDALAEQLFGLQRIVVPPGGSGDSETDVELRERCLARLRALNPSGFDPPHGFDDGNA